MPIPPRARPEITITAGAKELPFEATVIPPGAELLLPHDARQLAEVLQSVREISFAINYSGTSIKDNAVIEGLNTALGTVLANCENR